MRKIQIQDIKLLAPWFDVTNYAGTKSFVVDDWISSISIRRNVLSFLKKMKALSDMEMALPEDLEEVKQLMRELEHLRNNPLDIGACRSWRAVEGDFDEYAGIDPVKDFLFSDLITHYRHDQQTLEEDNWPADKAMRWAQISAKKDNVAAEDAFWNEITGEQKRRELHAERWGKITTPSFMPIPGELLNMPLGMVEGNLAPILIDTRATNSVIKEAFSKWLTEFRRDYPPEKSKRNKPDYEEWTDYGILPYLDLHIWAFEKEVEITDEVMAEAVTPDRSIGNFSTTTKPQANGLLRDLTELRAMGLPNGTDLTT